METTLPVQRPGLIDQMSRRLVFSLLERLEDCGLEIDDGQTHYFGDSGAALQARLQVNNHTMYTRLLKGGNIGVAESFVEGDWQSPDLVAVIRVFARNLATLNRLERRFGWISWPFNRVRHLMNRNSRKGSRTNIAAHYDLGNDMYRLFLDPAMQYSSAIYPSAESTLEEAQQFKLERICRQLELTPGDHLLEIGSGWGGLACYAASRFGCRVTTTTLSRQQYDYAWQQVTEQGLQDRVEVLLRDYRELEGQYDKLVSVEMIEAVGHRYLPLYFRKISSLLKPHGRLLIQAISIADQNYDTYRNSVDFIQRYIFPGGCLPSVGEMTRQLGRQTDMSVDSLVDYGPHYARTIDDWWQRFSCAAKSLQRLGYGGDFQRLWHFYFAYCEGGFREGTIGLAHLCASKPGARRCEAGGLS